MPLPGAKRPYARTNKCLDCKYFCNDAATMEQEIPGLKVMSSGWASVRADDGLCRLRQVYLAGYYTCERFQPAR